MSLTIAPATSNPACASLPADIALVNQTYTLPDPFTFLNGTAVRTAADWDCRAAQIKALFQRYELGDKPPRPPVLTSAFDATTSRLRITAGLNSSSTVSWTVNITYPAASNTSTPGTTNKTTSLVPAVIAYGSLSIPRPDGAAVILFNNGDVAAQNGPQSRGKGAFYDLYGANATAGALMAWAWGVSRIIDVLAANTTTLGIDPARVAVTGCSRNGKGAMVAGAFDERVALTLPQESGSGGDACWRVSRSMLVDSGLVTQTATEIIGENVWFSRAFDAFGATNASVSALPVDHHQLAALVAPRALYSTSNTDFLWLGDQSSFDCMTTARRVFASLGVEDRHGFSQDGGHAHCSFPQDQVPEIQGFYRRFLSGAAGADATSTNVFRTTGNWTYNATWAPWTAPSLVQAGARNVTTVSEGVAIVPARAVSSAVFAMVCGVFLWV